MMGLMSIPERIETGCTYLFYPCGNLFITERMALSELMLILAYSIDKHGLPIQVKTSVSIVSFYRPANGTNTEGCRNFIRRLRITLNHASQFIEIWIFRIPQDRILNRSLLANHFHFSRS